MKIFNPASGEVLTELPEDSTESVLEKYKKLKSAQPSWASRSIAERVACLGRFSDLLEKEKDQLALTLTSEIGKPLKESYNEIKGARDRIRFFLEKSEQYLQDEWIILDGGTREKIVYEPHGVVANISAWNYPYLVGVNVFVPALIGGNAVLYKPSANASLTGLHIQDLLYRAGVPKDIFEIIVGRGSVIGDYLLELPLNGYYFTGSYQTGKHIAEKVASKLVPCQLELGGKDPVYVMDDVERIDDVAASVLEGTVYNNGQSCCAVERIYVHEKIFDEFVESFARQMKELKIGDPLDDKTQIGPLSKIEQRGFLLSQIDDAVKKGATVLSGGKVMSNKGYYFEPAVLVNVNHDMAIMQEESFGPVVGIQKVSNDDEAIRLMLDSPYGLTSAVYSSNFDRAEQVMKKMNTGTVYMNCCDRVSASLPWSGRGHSGIGSTLSYHGIRAFVQPKAYHIRG
ncbi:MAG: aldehyde dehydrogenase family protein [Chitinophagaceae bacterium]|nr:aldehyde dehydrogenase family protein [Chitinophagaceae bacterium]